MIRPSWWPLYLILVLNGCGSAQVASALASGPDPRVFQRILVSFSIDDLRERELTEAAFTNPAGDSGATFLGLTGLVEDHRQFTETNVQHLLSTHEVDAALLIFRFDDPILGGRRADAGEVLAYLRPVDFSSVLEASLNAWGGDAGQRSSRTGPVQSIGDPWVRFTAVLYDVRSQRPVWAANARAEGALTTPGRLYRSIAAGLIEQLESDGVLR